MTPQQQLAWRVAGAVGAAERRFQRATGADWIEAYQHDWRVFDEVYELAMSPDRQIEFGRMKMIRRMS